MQMGSEIDRKSEASLPRESFGELLGQLANNSAALVRDEIQLAKQEMSEKVSVLRSAIFIVAVGSLIGMVAILALTGAAIIGLAHYGRAYRDRAFASRSGVVQIIDGQLRTAHHLVRIDKKATGVPVRGVSVVLSICTRRVCQLRDYVRISLLITIHVFA